MLCKAACTVRIAEKFSLDQKSTLGPDTGLGIGAADIVLYVNGINGNAGKLGSNPDAAKIGQNCIVRANFYVPNGTLAIEQKSSATGAFLARDVMVGENVELTLASRFASAGGIALTSLPPGSITAPFAVPGVARLQWTAKGRMELFFNGNPGSGYSVQASQDLKTWGSLSEVQAGLDGLIRFTDPASSELRMRFYRVVPVEAGNEPKSASTANR